MDKYRMKLVILEAARGKLKSQHFCVVILTNWWGWVDSNHRRHSQQIYSLSPLATREHPRIHLRPKEGLELVDGLEPPTC